MIISFNHFFYGILESIASVLFHSPSFFCFVEWKQLDEWMMKFFVAVVVLWKKTVNLINYLTCVYFDYSLLSVNLTLLFELNLFLLICIYIKCWSSKCHFQWHPFYMILNLSILTLRSFYTTGLVVILVLICQKKKIIRFGTKMNIDCHIAHNDNNQTFINHTWTLKWIRFIISPLLCVCVEIIVIIKRQKSKTWFMLIESHENRHSSIYIYCLLACHPFTSIEINGVLRDNKPFSTLFQDLFSCFKFIKQTKSHIFVHWHLWGLRDVFQSFWLHQSNHHLLLMLVCLCVFKL